jgi:hypothetical protein
MKTRPKKPQLVKCPVCGQPVRRRILKPAYIGVHVDRETHQQCIGTGLKIQP